MEALNLGSPSKRSIILLHAVHDCPSGRTAAIVRHVSFALITCCKRMQNFWQLLHNKANI